jgi:hypothetical protein
LRTKSSITFIFNLTSFSFSMLRYFFLVSKIQFDYKTFWCNYKFSSKTTNISFFDVLKISLIEMIIFHSDLNYSVFWQVMKFLISNTSLSILLINRNTSPSLIIFIDKCRLRVNESIHYPDLNLFIVYLYYNDNKGHNIETNKISLLNFYLQWT